MNILHDPSNFKVLDFYHYPTAVTNRIVEWDEGFHEGAPGLNEDVKDLFEALIDDLETLLGKSLRDNKIAMKVLYVPTNTIFYLGYKDWNWCLGLSLNPYMTGKRMIGKNFDMNS